jgi:hypothetical protein
MTQNMHRNFLKTSDSVERNNCAVVSREHGQALETDMSNIKLHVELLKNEMMQAWRDAADEVVEQDTREECLMKLDDLTSVLGETREALLDVGNESS